MGGGKKRRLLTVKAVVPELDAVVRKLGVDEHGAVQRAVTDAVMRNLPDFMPRRTGRLVGKLSKLDDKTLRVEGPYARFLFFGKAKSGADVDYSTEANPKAGPNWDRRMAAERGEAIAREARRAAR